MPDPTLRAVAAHRRADVKGPWVPRPGAIGREAVFAVLAVVSVLIGISRLPATGPPPVWVQAVDVGIAAAFFGDWVRRIVRSDERFRYALTHGYEVVFFIPFTLLPATLSGGDLLRGFRLVRFLRYLRYGRFLRLGLGLWRLPRRVRHIQRVAANAQLVAIVIVGLVVVNLGAAALALAEGFQRVGGYGGALWWSLSMFTTAAYDVPAPSTAAGRVVAGSLIVLGIGYIGVLTASLASALLRTEREEE